MSDTVGMTGIELFDTLSGDKLRVVAPKAGLKIFVCGPTVYDYPHIGNARTFIVFDALVKFLRSSGIKVFYLQNITDIDDKIIDRAISEKKTTLEITKNFLAIYLRDMAALGVNAVTKYAKATDHIPQIIKQISALIKKGHAYEIANEGIYFNVSTFSDYGKLSRRTITQAEDGVSRIDESINKKNKADFALWKFHKEQTLIKESKTKLNKPVFIHGEPAWKSPWGWGRPGWHIEDTAITEFYFGPKYDIHGGAMDLKFPHHEAEIAQQESASGQKPFVKIWLHGGFLTVNGKKMSKSEGNFVTVEESIKNHSSDIFRLAILTHHYRSPVDYNPKLMRESKTYWLRILEFLAKLDLVVHGGKTASLKVGDRIKNFEENFIQNLADDFNTPKALATLSSFTTEINPKIWDLSSATAKNINLTIRRSLNRLGFKPVLPKIPNKITKLANERIELRKNQQFMQSDALRKKINALGFSLEDTPYKTFIWPKE